MPFMRDKNGVRLDSIAVVSRTGARNLAAPLDSPTFTRANNGQPVFTLAQATGAATIYWPSVIDARAIFGASALDEYYLYLSTNHEGVHANSGIWLATGPTALGPWTGRGRVYRDDAGGTQTETPTVFKDPTGQFKAIMLYQQAAAPGAVGGQTTLWASSNDGVAWTRGGIAIDIPTDWPSDGHTGYATVTQYGGKLYAHSLAGGFSWPTWALSESVDGRKWRMQSEPLMYGFDIVGDGRRVEWNSTSIVEWRGRLWWIGISLNQPVWTDPRDGRIVVAPISNDMRRLVAKPEVQLYPTQGSEDVTYASVHAFVDRDGTLVLYYQCGNQFFAAKVI